MGRGRWQSPKRRQVIGQFTYLCPSSCCATPPHPQRYSNSSSKKHAPDPKSYLPASAPAPTSPNSSLTVQNTQILPQKTRPRSPQLSPSVRVGTHIFQPFPYRAKYSNSSSENTPDPHSYLLASASALTSSNPSLTVRNTQILPQKTRPRS